MFTASLAKYADPLLDLLDKGRMVRWRLFREACCPFEGNYVKDLHCLGRPLADSIIVDNSPHSCAPLGPAWSPCLLTWCFVKLHWLADSQVESLCCALLLCTHSTEPISAWTCLYWGTGACMHCGTGACMHAQGGAG